MVCPTGRPEPDVPGDDNLVRLSCISIFAVGPTADPFVLVWYFRLPLPEESPINFRMLPEYILEDIADYHVFLISCVPLHLASASLQTRTC